MIQKLVIAWAVVVVISVGINLLNQPTPTLERGTIHD